VTRSRDTADTQDNLGGAVAPFVAGKNKIINGDCFYNQRGFSSQTLSTETSVYIVDRFTGVNVLSGSSTFSVQQFTLGTAPVVGYEAKQYLRAVTTSQSSTFAGTIFGQTVEDVRTFAGQTVTVSFWAKAASGTPNVSFEFRQVFGTGGSPSATVENAGGTQKFAITTSWVRYSRTITLPSIAGKTLGTDNNSKLEYNIWVSAGSAFDSRTGSLGIQTNTFDLWGFQLEAGNVMTPFTTASGSIGGELALCQRYFERLNSATGTAFNPFGTGQCAAASFGYATIYYTLKRTSPSFSFSTTADFALTIANGNATGCTAISSVASGVNSALIQATVASVLVAGNATLLYRNSSTSAYIDISAEL
jgi:hypothetical protein